MMLSVDTANGIATAYDMSSGSNVAVLNRSFTVPTLGSKTITANGTYDATDDNLDGYSRVVVDVPTGSHTTQHLNCADSLSQINAVSTAQATQMYAYVNGILTNMGTGFWYLRNTYQQTQTMYT